MLKHPALHNLAVESGEARRGVVCASFPRAGEGRNPALDASPRRPLASVLDSALPFSLRPTDADKIGGHMSGNSETKAAGQSEILRPGTACPPDIRAAGAADISLADVAKSLGVSSRTVRRWITRLDIQRIYTSNGPNRWASASISLADFGKLRETLASEGQRPEDLDSEDDSDGQAPDDPRDTAGRDGERPTASRPEGAATAGQPAGHTTASEESRALVPVRTIQDFTVALNRLATVLERIEEKERRPADRPPDTHSDSPLDESKRGPLAKAVRAAELVLIPVMLVALFALVIGAGAKLGVWAEVARSLGV